jgi:hypothetical protein
MSGVPGCSMGLQWVPRTPAAAQYRLHKRHERLWRSLGLVLSASLGLGVYPGVSRYIALVSGHRPGVWPLPRFVLDR